MALQLPDYAFSSIAVAPDLRVNHAETEGGLIVTSRRGDPRWRGRFTTGTLEISSGNNQHASLRAFLSKAVDLNYQVDIIHPRHRYPSLYGAGTWTMVGNGLIVNATDLRNVVVSGIPVGTVLKRGDRLSFLQGATVAHRWIAADLTVTSATAQSLEVTPRLPIGVFVPAAQVVFVDPPMRVRIVPGSWDAAEVSEPTPISFDVVEAA